MNRGWMLIAALCPGVTVAQSTAPAPERAEPAAPIDIADVLAPIREKAKLPALAAVVTRGRELIAQGASGVRKVGDETRATLDDEWHLGSCTKQMTATLLAVLVEERKLRWNSTLGEVFPDVPRDEKWTGVTLQQLLAHRAGVPPRLDPEGEWVSVYQAGGTPREQREAVVRGTLAEPPLTEPGTAYVYSNGGFAIAGAMAERVCDAPWEDLMRAKIFRPLAMDSAGFGPPGSEERVDQPWGHRPDGTPDRADNPAAIAPAGLVHCSLGDWAKFVAVHTGGWRAERGDGPWLLEPGTLAKLHTFHEGDGPRYGFGWAMDRREWARGPRGAGEVLTHTGSNGKWTCVVWAAPERDMAVLVACNQGGDEAGGACDEVSRAVIEKFFGASK